MAESQNDFGPVNRIEARSEGQPGQRVFYLDVANEIEAASLTLEKQQLSALGRAIEEQLGRLSALRVGKTPPVPDATLAFAGSASLAFRVGQMALGFDERQGLFLLLAYAVEDEESERPTFSCQSAPEQLRALAAQIESVVNSGRPICPLCGLPIDATGHMCIRTNGHSKQSIPPVVEDSSDEEE